MARPRRTPQTPGAPSAPPATATPTTPRIGPDPALDAGKQAALGAMSLGPVPGDDVAPLPGSVEEIEARLLAQANAENKMLLGPRGWIVPSVMPLPPASARL